MSLASLVYAPLRRLPESEQRAALRKAAQVPLDVLELVGIAAGLIAAILFMRGGVATIGIEASAAAGFEVADVVLGAAIGSIATGLFLVRRMVRGLAAALRER